MYLSRLFINPHRRGTRFLMASPQRMHAAVLASFPPGAETESPQGRVLWRVDEADHALSLYVSSPTQPDLTCLVEQAGWPAASDTWQSASTDSLHARLSTGDLWRFRVTANPVRNESRGSGQRGKRYGHVTVDQQQEWFAKRAEGWGLSLAEYPGGTRTLSVTSRDSTSFPRRSDGHERTVSLSIATFDGILRVEDPDRLRHALGHGIGRAKAYGCGLLTLAPV